MSIGGGYHNYVAVSQIGGTLPPYIIANTNAANDLNFDSSWRDLNSCEFDTFSEDKLALFMFDCCLFCFVGWVRR